MIEKTQGKTWYIIYPESLFNQGSRALPRVVGMNAECVKRWNNGTTTQSVLALLFHFFQLAIGNTDLKNCVIYCQENQHNPSHSTKARDACSSLEQAQG